MLSDQEIISKLESYAYWQDNKDWSDIAKRFRELLKAEALTKPRQLNKVLTDKNDSDTL